MCELCYSIVYYHYWTYFLQAQQNVSHVHGRPALAIVYNPSLFIDPRKTSNVLVLAV